MRTPPPHDLEQEVNGEDFQRTNLSFVKKLDWTELTTNSRRPSIVTGCSYSTFVYNVDPDSLSIGFGKSLRERTP